MFTEPRHVARAALRPDPLPALLGMVGHLTGEDACDDGPVARNVTRELPGAVGNQPGARCASRASSERSPLPRPRVGPGISDSEMPYSGPRDPSRSYVPASSQCSCSSPVRGTVSPRFHRAASSRGGLSFGVTNSAAKQCPRPQWAAIIQSAKSPQKVRETSSNALQRLVLR